MSLKYKTLKKELLSVIKSKDSNVGVRDVVFGELASVRNYPAIRYVFGDVLRSEEQIIQTGNRISWDYFIDVQVMFTGTEGEHTSDNMMVLTDNIYNILQDQKTNGLLNGEVCDLDVLSLSYSSEPGGKGFVYMGTLELKLTVIENRD